MSVYDKPFDDVIAGALNILFDKKADIYTFAFYHDHETQAVSICADTRSNSNMLAREINRFKFEHFRKFIHKKDLDRAARFGSASERSFSLGDYKFKNLGWKPIKAPNNNKPFYLAMVNALLRHSKQISALSRNPEDLMFCCSTKNSEVGLTWLYSAR